MSDVYIVDALRTPVGKAPRGLFKNVLPDDLLLVLLKALQERYSSIDWATIGDVVIGCAMPEAEQGMNIARIATLRSGLPDVVPAMTINRFCASGVQSIASAAASIAQGQMDLAIAGGVESMSQVPLGGNKFTMNPSIFEQDQVAIAYGMGMTAEIVAKRYEVSREAQDRFALRSHERAIAALRGGAFEQEIVAVEVKAKNIDLALLETNEHLTSVRCDEGPREDTSLELLSRLKPVFAKNGSVTAGNSSQTSDGAGIALLANETALKRYDLKPIGRLVSYAVAGVAPEEMGIGPVRAIPIALQRAGLDLHHLDWIELNEAFAAQALAVINTLGLDHDKVNPLGGAIALGHPLGATGAIRTATVLHGLRRSGGRYGMVTMCIGTGMGAAAIFERL